VAGKKHGRAAVDMCNTVRADVAPPAQRHVITFTFDNTILSP